MITHGMNIAVARSNRFDLSFTLTYRLFLSLPHPSPSHRQYPPISDFTIEASGALNFYFRNSLATSRLRLRCRRISRGRAPPSPRLSSVARDKQCLRFDVQLQQQIQFRLFLFLVGSTGIGFAYKSISV
ncbi:unnamed protein product [Cochlearia groenlandica]